MAVRKDRKTKPLYRQKTPKIQGDDFVHAEPISPAHFELREDGSIKVIPSRSDADGGRPQGPPRLTFRDDTRNLWLYQGNSLELLDAIAAKHPEGRFDCIFADPPYFLSNGGISCHAGKMVKVDKGDWDKSRGAEVNHEFNLEWLKRCQKVLKPNGTIWIGLAAPHAHRSALDNRAEIIPTGLNHSAQGCEERATLGQPPQTISNPERVVSVRAHLIQPFQGCFQFIRPPGVATPSSRQRRAG